MFFKRKKARPVQPHSACMHTLFLESLLREKSLPEGENCTVVINRVSFADKKKPQRTFTTIVFEGQRPDIIEFISTRK